MNVVVIHESDHDDNEDTVIGVSSSVKNAEKIIEEHYGKGNFVELEHKHIGDSNLEYEKLLRVKYRDNSTFKVTVTLEWFKINEI